MRNAKKAIEKFNSIVEKNPRVDVTINELEEVMRINDNFYFMTLNGIKAGFAWGYEFAKREEKKG